jgi:hypothetical protein
MKALWNETREIEKHVFGLAETGDELLFEAKLLIGPGLQDKVLWQKKTYAIIKQYGRRQLKKEIEAVHQKLFTTPGHNTFSQRIRRLFTN